MDAVESTSTGQAPERATQPSEATTEATTEPTTEVATEPTTEATTGPTTEVSTEPTAKVAPPRRAPRQRAARTTKAAASKAATTKAAATKAAATKAAATKAAATQTAANRTAATRPARTGAAAAAETVTMRHQVTFVVPVFGRVWLGEPRHLPFYAGVAALAAFGVVDWPVAAIIVVGKALADNAHRQVLREFGSALEEEA